MSATRLLLDENVNPLLAEILKQHGYDAVAVEPLGMAGTSDEDLLRWAARENRAILTQNTAHFLILAREYAERGWEYAGIIVSENASLRQLLARMLRLLTRKQAEDLMNCVEWLQNYR